MSDSRVRAWWTTRLFQLSGDHCMRKYDEAEPRFEQPQSIRERALAQERPVVAQSLNEWAEVMSVRSSALSYLALTTPLSGVSFPFQGTYVEADTVPSSWRDWRHHRWSFNTQLLPHGSRTRWGCCLWFLRTRNSKRVSPFLFPSYSRASTRRLRICAFGRWLSVRKV